MLLSAPGHDVRDGHREVGVIARAVSSERLDLARVGDLTVTYHGVAVPLQQIAKIEYSHKEPILWRRNRDMAITVRSTSRTRAGADVTNQIRRSCRRSATILTGLPMSRAGRSKSAKAIVDLHPVPLMVIVMLRC